MKIPGIHRKALAGNGQSPVQKGKVLLRRSRRSLECNTFLYFCVCGIVFYLGGRMSTRTARLTIDMDKSDHKRLKMAASMMGVSIKNLVLMSVDEFMHRKPNKVTVKAMKQSEIGKGIKKFNNLDELFEDLGL